MKHIYLIISFVLFLLFFGNVMYAARGNPSVLIGPHELILLCLCVLFFEIGILRAEKRANEAKEADKKS